MSNKIIDIEKYINKGDREMGKKNNNSKNNLIYLDNYRNNINTNSNNAVDRIVELLQKNSKRMDDISNIEYPDIVSPDKDIYNKVKEIDIYEDIYNNIYSYIYPIYNKIKIDGEIKTMIINNKNSDIFISMGLSICNEFKWNVSSNIYIVDTNPSKYFYKEVMMRLVSRLMLEYIYSKTSLRKYESPESLSISGAYSGSISTSSNNNSGSVITKAILNMVIVDILNRDFKTSNRIDNALEDNDNIINIIYINNKDINTINNIQYSSNLERNIMINAYSDIRSGENEW